MANINLSWVGNSTNEDGFHIYRSIDGEVESLLSDTGPDVSVFTDADLKPGRYVYSVSAFNTAGESSRVPSNEVIVPPVVTTPEAPTNVVAVLA